MNDMNQTDLSPGFVHAGDTIKALDEHREAWARYARNGYNCIIDQNDKENAFVEDWQVGHYFSVGEDALRLVMDAGKYRPEPPGDLGALRGPAAPDQ